MTNEEPSIEILFTARELLFLKIACRESLSLRDNTNGPVEEVERFRQLENKLTIEWDSQQPYESRVRPD